MGNKLLIIEDCKDFSSRLAKFLESKSYCCISVSSLPELFSLTNVDKFSHAIIDLRIGADSGVDALEYLLSKNNKCHIIMLTGFGTINTAVNAIKKGAKHFLTKPASGEDIIKALSNENLNQVNYVSSLAEKEKEYILSLLEQNGGNISQTAKELKIHRRSLQRKLAKII